MCGWQLSGNKHTGLNMKKLLISTLLVLSFVFSTDAQKSKYDDKVKLKNGSVIYGTIVENLPDEHIKILLGGRETIKFFYEEIELIKDGNHRYRNLTFPQKGFFNHTELGLIFDKEPEEFDNPSNLTNAYFSIQTVNGYRFSKYLNVGAGFGLDYYGDVAALPLYLSIRGELFHSRVTPYYRMDFGKSFAWERDNNFVNYDEVKGGLMYHPGIGMRVNFSGSSLMFNIGYKIQKMKIDINQMFGPESIMEKRKMRNITVSTGIVF